jgi:hypothetical protein
MRSSRVVDEIEMYNSRVVDRLTANAEVQQLSCMGSTTLYSDTVESEGRQMKQC